MSSTLAQFRELLAQSLSGNTFVKASLGNYQGDVSSLKNVYVRRVSIKRSDKLSFTYRHKTKDIIKNYDLAEGVGILMQFIINDFWICTLFSSTQEVVLERLKSGKVGLRIKNIAVISDQKDQISLSQHDKIKKRLISSEDKAYLASLKVTDSDGNVLKSAQDKFKQINHYIEILSSLFRDMEKTDIKHVVDMGSGKGYLTFALYDFLHNVLNIDAEVIGVEFREDLVLLCNRIARESRFDKLGFVEGTIQEFKQDSIDLLIALHACDTATDDAINKGMVSKAKLIVVAPCCHKQIRKQMEKGKVKNELSFLTRYGVFLERQAEMVTDGIRTLILQYFGYKTKVVEFVSDVHTPKNVLLIAVKSQVPTAERQLEIIKEIKAIKSFFGIEKHHLELISGLQID